MTNAVKELAHIKDLICKLKLDRNAEEHNTKVLRNVFKSLSQRILATSKFINDNDDETRKIISEANADIREQGITTDVPMVGDIVELLVCSKFMEDHIRNAHGIPDNKPIRLLVTDVNFARQTVTCCNSIVFRIQHVKVVQVNG